MMRILCCLLMAALLAACGSKEERRDELFQNGLRLESEGRMAEAVVEARNVVKLDPKHAGAYLLLARGAMKDQNWREAFAGFQRAVELEPENAEALLGVGRLYLLSGETGKADEMAGRILKVDPRSVDGLLLRVGALIRAREFDAALAQLDQVFAVAPGNEDAVLALSVIHAERGRISEALRVVDEALKARPESRAMLFRAATLAADAGQYADAEARLLALKALEPGNQGVQALLAALYERMGDEQRVEALLRDMLAADVSSEDARLRLVDFHLRRKNPGAALALIAEAPGGPTPRLRLAQAGAELAQGRTDEAQVLLAALADDPDAGPVGLDARMRLAELLLRKGDSSGAMAQVDLVLSRNPGDVRAHAARGRLLMMAGKHEDAVGEFRIAAKDSPDDAGLAILLARAQFAQGNLLSGVESLRAFLDRKPEAVSVRLELAAHFERQVQPEEALKILRAGAVGGVMPPELLLAMGDVEARRDRLAESERQYQEAAKSAQARPAALMRLGRLAAARQDWDGARMYFGDLLRENPDAHGGAEGVVAVEFASGKTEDALAWARQRAAARPGDAQAADLLGRALVRAGKTDEAEKAFRDAQARAPQWSAPAIRLARLYSSTGRGDVAISEARAALAKNPGSAPEALLLGQLLQQTDGAEEAEKIYRDLLTRHPDLKPAANNLAYLIATRAESTPAALQEALALAGMAASSGDPTAYDTLGWVHYRLGDRKTALDYLRQAHEALPEDPTVTYHLAKVLAEEGRGAEAKDLLVRVMVGEGEFPEVAEARELMNRL